MAISEVSNMAMMLLLVVFFFSRLADVGHVALSGSCQTVNWEGHVITKRLAAMHGRYKMTVRKATRIQLGMTQAASDVKHVTQNEAGEYETTSECTERTSVDHSTFDEVKTAYEDAKKRVGEAYQTAMETMTESAKEEYKDAKEKASKATGDLGAKMRERKEEL